MKATGGRLIHWALLAGLLIAATLIVLVWSTHSVSYPNPADARRSVDQLSRNGARDREFAVTRLLLLCLDDLSKGDNGGAVAQCSSVTIIDPQNVTAYKLRGGKQIAVQRFCAGVEQAAGLIGRAYEREDMDSVAVDIDPACCEAARNFVL